MRGSRVWGLALTGIFAGLACAGQGQLSSTGRFQLGRNATPTAPAQTEQGAQAPASNAKSLAPSSAPEPRAEQNQGRAEFGVAALGPVTHDARRLESILTGARSAKSANLKAQPGVDSAPLEQGIQRIAARRAEGMQPDGPLMTARLDSGGHALANVSLHAGHCYTIVGLGGSGVVDYEIYVLTAPPLAPQVLAQSTSGGTEPAVGPNDTCLKNPYPLPMPVRIDMHVTAGRGLVGARLYKR